MDTLLWILAVILVVAGVLALFRRQILWGVVTLLQATAITDRWGTADYGYLSGVLSAPMTLAAALAPWAGAALAGPLGGYPALFATLAGLTALAALLVATTDTVPVRTGQAG